MLHAEADCGPTKVDSPRIVTLPTVEAAPDRSLQRFASHMVLDADGRANLGCFICDDIGVGAIRFADGFVVMTGLRG